MKVALVRQRYTAFGGAERFVARAIEALQGQGAEVTVVTRQWEDEGSHQTLECNPFYLGSLWRDWGFARGSCALLQNHSFDLVQSHERIPCCDVYRAGDGVHREWLRQRRRVLGSWGRLGLVLNPYHRYTLAAERSLFASHRLKAVICNSRMVKEEIREHFGLPEESLHVIYSGVDGTIFHPGLRAQFGEDTRRRLGIPSEATLFLFVGSGFQRKGLAILLQALATLPAEARLLVVGKDKHEARYEAMAESPALAGRVHFMGGQKDVRPFYGAADALVLPTLYDPFPNVALEALAAGLPVFTSSKSGAAEFLREGENGFVCDALDRDGLGRRMAQFLHASPEHRGAMSALARRAVESCTLDAMGAELLTLYQRLLP